MNETVMETSQFSKTKELAEVKATGPSRVVQGYLLQLAWRAASRHSDQKRVVVVGFQPKAVVNGGAVVQFQWSGTLWRPIKDQQVARRHPIFLSCSHADLPKLQWIAAAALSPLLRISNLKQFLEGY